MRRTALHPILKDHRFTFTILKLNNYIGEGRFVTIFSATVSGLGQRITLDNIPFYEIAEDFITATYEKLTDNEKNAPCGKSE